MPTTEFFPFEAYTLSSLSGCSFSLYHKNVIYCNQYEIGVQGPLIAGDASHDKKWRHFEIITAI